MPFYLFGDWNNIYNKKFELCIYVIFYDLYFLFFPPLVRIECFMELIIKALEYDWKLGI